MSVLNVSWDGTTFQWQFSDTVEDDASPTIAGFQISDDGSTWRNPDPGTAICQVGNLDFECALCVNPLFWRAMSATGLTFIPTATVADGSGSVDQV